MDLIQLKNINMQFSKTTVLNDVSMDIRVGEVHALLGENGAGKSTLIKILGGIYQKTAGEIEFLGKHVEIRNVKDSQALGVRIIHQEISLCPNLSVAANILLGNETSSCGVLNRKANLAFAEKAMAEIDASIDVRAIVGNLTIAQQQIVEIAKAVAYHAKLVVMDEPTSSLSEAEVRNLYRIVRKLKSSGVSVLYVSHRMEEIFDLSDRITVLRDGNKIATLDTKQAEYNQLIAMLVGREVSSIYKHKRRICTEPALTVQNLERENCFRDVSFHVNKGEIVGFYGLVGAGRSEIFETLYGTAKAAAGNVQLFDQAYENRTVRNSLDRSLALIPESRKEQGIFEDNSIAFNASLCVLQKFISAFGLDHARMGKFIDTYLERLHVKMASPRQRIGDLSGGNQQKVVIAKILATGPRLLVMDEPTRGIDVGAKAEIYALMDELAEAGVSIVLISSELPEIINMSDRVYVMREGRIAAEACGSNINQEYLMRYAIGGTERE